MTDYYTHFAVALGDLSAKKIEYWRGYDGHRNEDGDECSCFDVRIHDDTVVLCDEDGSVVMDHVAAVLRAYLCRFRISAPAIVPYANTASRSVVDAFDGGVIVVWARREAWLTASHAGEQIAAGEEPGASVIDYATALDELDESGGGDDTA